jgi:hypothetical protein
MTSNLAHEYFSLCHFFTTSLRHFKQLRLISGQRSAVCELASWRVGVFLSAKISVSSAKICEKPLSEYFFNRKGRKVLCKAREGKILNSIVNYVPIVVKN